MRQGAGPVRFHAATHSLGVGFRGRGFSLARDAAVVELEDVVAGAGAEAVEGPVAELVAPEPPQPAMVVSAITGPRLARSATGSALVENHQWLQRAAAASGTRGHLCTYVVHQ